MSTSLFSPRWYRVANLHPRLRRHVQVQRRPSRGQVWFVLRDTLSGRHHRVNEAAWRVAGRFDGSVSVQQAWNAVRELHGEQAPTQHEVIHLLSQLDAAELIQCESTPDVAELFSRGETRKQALRRKAVNPLSFRVPLFDPTRALQWLAPFARFFFAPWALLLWGAAIVCAGAVALLNGPALQAYAGLHMLTPRHLFLAWLCYPLIKAVHEFAHACAVHVRGGEVHQMGVSLLLFVPVPYVDASASNAFAQRGQRMLVAAAGILAELLLAAIGLAVWLNTQDGLIKDIAFVVMFIGSISTVLFNGNPLLRFDGYFVMCDALDLPNLGQRSNAYLLYLVQRRLLGVRSAVSPAASGGEAAWFVAYGMAAAIYRVFVAGLIVFWVASQSLLLGIAAQLWSAFTIVLQPLWRAAHFLLNDARLARRRGRALAIGVGGAALVVGLAGWLPLPLATHAEGVVWVPENARVRAGTDGFVVQLMAGDGQPVKRGDVLMRLEDPNLLTERDTLLAQLTALDVEHQSALFIDPNKAQSVAADIERVCADLKLAEEHIALLDVKSPADGTLVVPRPRDLPMRFAAKGTMLGYVLTGESIELRVPVAEANVALVRDRTQAVAVRLAETPAQAIGARLLRQVPAAADALPSAALGDRGGGPHITDPADKEGTRTLAPVFVFDLGLPATAIERIGGRAWVRFDHGSESLSQQAWRRLSQAFLQHIDGR
jgi:putative peptide zinc metalloprotease protein